MASNFHSMQTSVEVRHAQQVAYSVFMVGDITAGYDPAVDAGDLRLARCMLDAFYVHVRLLADFLVMKTSKKDFGPAAFQVDWVRPDTPEARRLREHWKVASSYVVHFGERRVPTDLDELQPFQVGGELFRSMAGDALAVFLPFLALLETAAGSWEGGALIPDLQQEPELWQQRLRAEQAQILRRAFDTAAKGVGLEFPSRQ